jgi:hypothetical protein
MPAVRRHTRAAQNTGDAKAPVSDDSEAKLAALVEELDLEVESKCQSLQSDAERMVSFVRSQFKCQLAKLPKKITSMKVSEFFAKTGAAGAELEVPELRMLAEKFHMFAEGGDMEMKDADEAESILPERVPLMVVSNNADGSKTVLRSTRKTAKPSSIIAPAEEGAPRNTRRTTRTQSIVGATPAAKPSAGIIAQTPAFNVNLPYTPAVGHHQSIMGGTAAPSTCLRLPRRGESILSSRGSPLASMKSDASAQMIMDGDNKIAALAINNKQGETMNIADPAVCAALPKSVKLKAAQNVLAMQAQLEAMLANLR